MFDSGITAKALIELLKSEVDVAYQIPDESYIGWLNSLEQLMYSEIIKQYGAVSYNMPSPAKVAQIVMGVLTVPADENPVRFEDITAVYVNSSLTNIYGGEGIELTQTTPASGRVFNNVYFRLGMDLYCKCVENMVNIAIVYFARPKIKTLTTMATANVKLPIEFIDIAKAKLRAEAYKLMNEDQVAAKWIGDYNALIETFKVWCAQREANFGV